MFNVTILKMRDIKKYIIEILIVILIIILTHKYFTVSENKKNKITNRFSKINMTNCLEQTVPTISSINGKNKNILNVNKEIEKKDIVKNILNTQVSIIGKIKNDNQEKEYEEIEKIEGTNDSNKNQEQGNVEINKETNEIEETKVRSTNSNYN